MRSNKGFTLIELLVVLAILSLLAGLVGPQVMKALDESRTKTARIQIEDLGAALDLFRLDNGRFPNSSEGLNALVNKPPTMDKWNGPYLKKRRVPKDPWDYEYHYQYPGEHGSYDLYSLGSDNAAGGDGDAADVLGWE